MNPSNAHESAELHVCGEATYTDDIAELNGTLHAALGLSQKAHARIHSLDLEAVKASPGVIAVLRHKTKTFPEKTIAGRSILMTLFWPTGWCSLSVSRCLRLLLIPMMQPGALRVRRESHIRNYQPY